MRLGRQVDLCPAAKVDDAHIPRLVFERLPMAGGRVNTTRRAYGVEAYPNRYLLVAVRQRDRVALAYLAGADPAERATVAAGPSAAAAR